MSFGGRVLALSNPAPERRHHIARLGGRMIEEAVELALACGSTPADIAIHVLDALHNEARKAGCYPSQIGNDSVTDGERIVELADMDVMLDTIRELSGFSSQKIQRAAERKVRKLERAHAYGELKIVDGIFYLNPRS